MCVGLGLVYLTTHNYEVGFPIQNLLINFLGQNIAINAQCKILLIYDCVITVIG